MNRTNNPRRTAALLLGLAVLAAAGTAEAFKLNLDKLGEIVQKVTQSEGAFAEVSEPREIEIGEGLAARLLGAVPLVADPEVQRYVNHVGLWLALQSARPDLPWRFGVLDTDTVNAFAAPGGCVFVTKGLLQSMTNEAELAGVLAHEIAHVVRRHHLVAIQEKARTELAADVVAGLVTDNRAVSGALLGVGMNLYAKGLDRGDELDADQRGVVLAARAGYEPYGLVAVLQALAARGDEGALALMTSTHPSPGQRLDALEPIFDERFAELKEPRTLDSRFLAVRSRLSPP